MSDAIVGNCEGRGFVIGATPGQRYVVTAAHCLQRSSSRRPNLAFTLSNVIGRLGTKRGTIWAELCMANLTGESRCSASLTSKNSRMKRSATSNSPPSRYRPRRRQLRSSRIAAAMQRNRRHGCSRSGAHGCRAPLTLSGVEIKAGMSGSPLLDEDGAAIGFIPALQRNGDGNNTCPSLKDCLPGWLWKQLQPCE